MLINKNGNFKKISYYFYYTVEKGISVRGAIYEKSI